MHTPRELHQILHSSVSLTSLVALRRRRDLLDRDDGAEDSHDHASRHQQPRLRKELGVRMPHLTQYCNPLCTANLERLGLGVFV